MIALVVVTLLTYRGAKVNNIVEDVAHAADMNGAFASQLVGSLLSRSATPRTCGSRRCSSGST